MASPLDPLFRPRSVAVVGASRQRGTIGAEVLRNLLAHGFQGPVYPVNAGARAVQSVRAYPRVVDVPDDVDLAIIVVPRDHVLAVVDDCAAKGVRAIVVISVGFGETGPEGRALEAELVRRVRAAGMRMVGPNCLGLVTTDPAVSLDATFAPTWPPAGNVAFASQSGAVGVAVLDGARELGIGISEFVSMGNKADVSGNDLLEHWADDPRTRVVLLYLESFGNPRRFMDVARRVARKKPIVVVKSGRTAAGARAATSHTGALAGLDVAVDALLGQAGVLRTANIRQLFDVGVLLSSQPVPAGGRVAILTNAGGPGIMAADACESEGLEVPPPSPPTEAALRALLPPEASVRNPIDLLASAPAAHYEAALRHLLADPGYDAAIALFVPPIVTDAVQVAEAIRAAAAGGDKPVLTCFMGEHGVPDALATLRAARLPTYAFPEPAAMALAAAVRYGRWLQRPVGCVPELEVDAAAASARVRARGPGERWLGPDEAMALLGAYGIAAPPFVVAATPDAAAEGASRLGFPVAVKLVSSSVTHKSDVGGVVLDVPSAGAVWEAASAMRRRLEEAGRAGDLEGFLVQRMAPRGVETFIGLTHDPAFGPLVAFGIGGTNVEVWRDVVFRVAPLSDVDAHEMLDQIRAVRLLDGFRGAPPADRAALADALLRVSRLAVDLPEVRELDLNPLIARAPGAGVVAVDARVRVRVPADAP